MIYVKFKLNDVLKKIILNSIPIENVRPFPANSLRKSATNFSLICSFCLKKSKQQNKTKHQLHAVLIHQ